MFFHLPLGLPPLPAALPRCAPSPPSPGEPPAASPAPSPASASNPSGLLPVQPLRRVHLHRGGIGGGGEVKVTNKNIADSPLPYFDSSCIYFLRSIEGHLLLHPHPTHGRSASPSPANRGGGAGGGSSRRANCKKKRSPLQQVSHLSRYVALF